MQDRPLDPSLKLLLDALANSPENPPLRAHVAASLEKAGQHRTAVTHYDRLGDDPQHGDEALVGATRCLLALQDVGGPPPRLTPAGLPARAAGARGPRAGWLRRPQEGRRADGLR